MAIHSEELHDYDHISEIVADALSSSCLNAWEQEFIDGIAAKLAEYGRRTFISDAQRVVLERIEDKIYRMG